MPMPSSKPTPPNLLTITTIPRPKREELIELISQHAAVVEKIKEDTKDAQELKKKLHTQICVLATKYDIDKVVITLENDKGEKSTIPLSKMPGRSSLSINKLLDHGVSDATIKECTEIGKPTYRVGAEKEG